MGFESAQIDDARFILNGGLGKVNARGKFFSARNGTAPGVFLRRLWYNAAMRAVVQRVDRASVKVGDEITGEIAKGLLVLLGVGQEDTEADAGYLAEKVAGLRIFEDEAGKMNLSVVEIGGAVLAVSQFTLLGDVRRGKRPSFDAAARPERARELYGSFVEHVRALGLRCETGRFQEMMEVELVNSGPVTILLDSKKLF